MWMFQLPLMINCGRCGELTLVVVVRVIFFWIFIQKVKMNIWAPSHHEGSNIWDREHHIWMKQHLNVEKLQGHFHCSHDPTEGNRMTWVMGVIYSRMQVESSTPPMKTHNWFETTKSNEAERGKTKNLVSRVTWAVASAVKLLQQPMRRWHVRRKEAEREQKRKKKEEEEKNMYRRWIKVRTSDVPSNTRPTNGERETPVCSYLSVCLSVDTCVWTWRKTGL